MTRITPILSVLSLLCVSGAAYANQILRTVVITTQSAPDTSPNVNFLEFGPPRLNESSETAFLASLFGSGVTSGNALGIWSEGGGEGLQLAARQGFGAPETTTGVVFNELGNFVLNDGGNLLFRSTLSGGTVNAGNETGVWLHEGANDARLLTRTGTSIPTYGSGVVLAEIYDNTGGFFPRHRGPVFGNSNEAAFRGEGLGPGVSPEDDNHWGMMRVREGGNPEVEIIRHEPTIGVAGGIDFLGVSALVMNNRGQIGFIGNGRVGGGSYAYIKGVVDPNDGLRVVHDGNDPGPGLGSLRITNNVEPPVINDAGHMAFWGGFSGGLGIWSEGRGNGLELVTRTGVSTPGLEAGQSFRHLNDPVIGHTGHVAFLGFLDDSAGIIEGINDVGIWKQSSDFSEVELVVRDGEAVPGAMAGSTFALSRFATSFNQVSFVLNKERKVAFGGEFLGPAGRKTGVWAEDQEGNLVAIAVAGQQLDVDDGVGQDLRTISWINFWGSSGNEDGLASAFNDLGQVAFSAGFTDGTQGVFVSNLVAIPEPATWMVLLVGMMVILCRRRVAL